MPADQENILNNLSRRKFLQFGVGAAGSLALASRVPSATGLRRSDGATTFTYNLWNTEPSTSNALLQKMASAYNATTDMKVRFNISAVTGSGATLYPSKIQSLISSGSPPDLFENWVGTLASPYIDEGAVQPLTAWFEKYQWNKVLAPAAISYVTFNGHPYEVPTQLWTMPMWYNKSLFSKAGAKVPTTYAEWQSTNNALVKANITPGAEGVIDGWDIMRLYEQLLETAAGATLHDELIQFKTSWNHPAVADSFDMLKEWGDKWLEKGALGTNPNDSALLFTSGKAAQSVQGGWEAGSLPAATASDFGMFVPPKMSGGNARIAGFAVGYQIGSHVKGAALEALGGFFDWFIQPKTSRKFFMDGATATIGGVPAGNPLSLEALKITDTAGVYLVQDEALGTILQNDFYTVQQGVLAGSISPQTAAVKMSNFVAASQKPK